MRPRRRKKAATGYDGVMVDKADLRRAGVGMDAMQNVNVEEQIRKLHEKYKTQK